MIAKNPRQAAKVYPSCDTSLLGIKGDVFEILETSRLGPS